MHNEPDHGPTLPQRLAWPGFVLDLARGDLLDAQARPSGLRAQALNLLLVLGKQAGQVVSKDELMRRVGTMASDSFHPGEPSYRYCAHAIADLIATHAWPRIPQETRP